MALIITSELTQIYLISETSKQYKMRNRLHERGDQLGEAISRICRSDAGFQTIGAHRHRGRRRQFAHESDIRRRLASVALVCAFAEGLLVQSTIQHTSLAFLHMELHVESPVFAGDTIRAECEIVEARRSHSRPNQGLVRARVRVVKQDGTMALVCTPLRMLPRNRNSPI